MTDREIISAIEKHGWSVRSFDFEDTGKDSHQAFFRGWQTPWRGSLEETLSDVRSYQQNQDEKNATPETRAKFNWLTTLKRLAKRKTVIDPDKHNELRRMAGNWPTCACGELCASLPRLADGSPTDKVTRTKGLAFYAAVWNGRWPSALRTFLKIEKRTALLLRKGDKR